MTPTIEQRLQRLEDIFAIQKLKRTYIDLVNGGWDRPTHDYRKIPELWIEGGSFDARPQAYLAVGHEQLRDCFKQSHEASPFAIHYMTNPVIEVDGDSASGHWEVLVTITLNKDEAFLWMGVNDDRYVRTPQGWRFKSVKCTCAAFTPYQVGWGKMRFPPGMPAS